MRAGGGGATNSAAGVTKRPWWAQVRRVARARDDQVLAGVSGSLGGNRVKARPTPSFLPRPARFCPGVAEIGAAFRRAGGPAYLLHPEELVEVELHLLHQVK